MADHGSFIISLAQTEIDGMRGAPLELLNVGWRWRWRGEALRIDSPLVPVRDAAGDDMRERVARKARRIARMTLRGMGTPPAEVLDAEQPAGRGFVLSDGQRSYAATVIEVAGSPTPMLVFSGALPPQDCDLWVTDSTLDQPRGPDMGAALAGLTGLVEGTRIAAPGGSRRVEELVPGDLVRTVDDDVQEVIWVGSHRLDAQALRAAPRLRPLRIRAGAFGDGVPGRDVLVAPSQRIVIATPAVQSLFNAGEVFVPAAELVVQGRASVDHHLAEVTYVHILLERHGVLMAAGLPTESWHPADGDLSTLPRRDLSRLEYLWPSILRDPQSYGDHARRVLSPSEAAILEGGRVQGRVAGLGG